MSDFLLSRGFALCGAERAALGTVDEGTGVGMV